MPEYVIDPKTGQTINLPEAFGGYMGLPQAPLSDYAEQMANGQRNLNAAMAASGPAVSPVDDPSMDTLANPTRPSDLAGQIYMSLPPGLQHSVGGPLTDVAAGRPVQYDNPDLAANVAFENKLKADQTARAIEAARKYGKKSPMVADSGVAHLEQSTGPMGTINQIGQGALPSGSPQGQYASQADLDQAMRDQATAIPGAPNAPIDPNKPEQAGADLQRQGLGLAENSAMVGNAADQREADAVAAELDDRKKRVAAVQAETERQNAAKQARLEEIHQNVKDTTDAWANYKVDPGRRWKNTSTGQKIGAAISVAMSALGDALQHKSGPNLAIEMINKAIDDDVNAQVDERQHLGDVATRTRTSLDDYRQEFGDWQQARAAKLSEEYKRTADEIERIAASTRGDKAKANALAMVGDLRTRAGALEQGIATSAFQREMKQAEFAEQKRAAKAQEGLGWANMKQSDQHFNAEMNQRGSQFDQEMKLKRDQLAAEQKTKVDEYAAKASAEQVKDLRESGIKDPTTGQYIMNKDKPVLARNAAEGADIQKTVDGTQTMLSTIDRIKAKIANDPGYAKLNPTEKQAALSSELDGLTLLIKDAYQTGALDKGSIEFTNSYTGGDPTKLTSKALFSSLGLGSDPGEKTTAKLDVVAKTAETRALNRLGNPEGFKFARDEKVQETSANKAAFEVGQGSPTDAAVQQDLAPRPGAQGVYSVINPFGTKSLINPFGEDAYDKAQREAEQSGSLKYPGFRKEKEAALDTLVAGVRQGDKQSEQRLLEMVGNDKTPGLSGAAMTIVDTLTGGQGPLYQKALQQLPEDIRNQRIAIDSARNFQPIKLYPNSGVKVKK